MKEMILLAALLMPLGLRAASQPDPSLEETVSRPYESPLNFGLDLKYVPTHFEHFTNATGHGGQIAFEWLPIGKKFGKPVIGGFAGGGHIKNIGTAHSKVTFTTIPLGAYVGYRLDFLDNQVLVPFAKVGRSVTLIRTRPGANSRFDSWDYSVGLELCLNAIDPRSARQLDQSTGINGTYLVAEWVKSIGNRGTTQPNLSREEWQFALRFEM